MRGNYKGMILFSSPNPLQQERDLSQQHCLLMEGVGGGEIKINSFFLNLIAVRVLGRIAQHDWVG